MHHLIDDTDAALARQTLLQVASLPIVPTPRQPHRSAVPRWNFEIPFVTPQGTAMAQFEISRDGGGDEVEAAKRTWQARFSLNVEPAGPVHALVSLYGDKTFVRMWAERPPTAQQLRAGIGELSQALTRPSSRPATSWSATAPRRNQHRRAGHFLDRATERARNQLAIALHYERQRRAVVVAKGKGTIGAKIVEIAKEHDIPIEENEVLAGALSKVELGEEIPPDLYKAVAEVLVFVLRLSGRAR